ncbi:NADP-dependent oxidoreductase [Amycolatopsis regifaucium]|uniref:NADPH:quinone reductase n=1 Tax=Amycolatopsis regifaucium TaxID=546365 RepID=A0A154MD64_9PSEU|nr:NADP-dependent oxidoreductase [Amycolatopsis regifaucium]KZB82518.1 NADPH:quinone reductase [Amycolatopsis regifaucium]OKA06891.1 NADPH:quinone reductase [Amycolatopsis regifaucium]SFH28935.1 NADPH:quinone reductase [Amycolatopsis regifaucium]
MRAITITQYGEPDVLRVAEVPVPEPGPGQVRVAVKAAGVNPIDWKIRSGAMAEVRAVEFPHILGLELAGVVDAVDEGAGFAVGDEIFGWADTGAYAEYALATNVTRKPAGLSWPEAAALPIAGETALRVLGELEVKPGETVVIHGASGQVGRFATQAAVALGATVIGLSGARSSDEVEALGALPVEYGDGWVSRVRSAAPDGVDAVFDAAGFGVLSDSVELLGSPDRLITIADPAAYAQGLKFSASGSESPAVLEDLVSRELKIKLGSSYGLAEAAEAHRESATGHAGGKITLTVD